jgi:uncharacterized protein (TIGR03435 family)
MIAIANHLWQSTAFAAAAALLAWMLRRSGARARYALWLAVSLKFLVPFSLLVTFGSRIAPPRVVTLSPAFHAIVAMEARGRALVPPASPASPLVPILWALWSCGTLAILLRWFLRWRRIRAIARTGTAADFYGTSVVLCPAPIEPGVFGVFRPILLLPAGLNERLDPDQLASLLAHERCHIRWRDNLASALHTLVEAIFWFHPLVWWLGARLVEEREHACDEEVLRLGNGAESYARGVLEVCEFCLEAPLACVSRLTGADLDRRVEQIMTHRPGRPLARLHKSLLAAAGILACALPVVSGLLHPARVRAQQPAGTKAFEVVSLKPSDPAMRGLSYYTRPGGRLIAKNVSLRRLIDLAYRMKAFQVSGGPTWIDSARFDIEGKAQDPHATEAQLRQMLQPMLAERFHLVFHRESKELPLYALVVAKGGPKLLPPHDPSRPGGVDFRMGGTQIIGTNAPILGLADALSERLQRTVVDKTGVDGRYDFKLAFTPDDRLTGFGEDNVNPDPEGASLFAALSEQLGLKLEGSKGPVEIFVIDRAERPSEN